ncbi:MAG TPA: DMT family transporter [Candidatus Ozemobacteraceae bacterium]|nr:DMT family transporter [Candidatus Ozemobacteraceae bacterium]
MSHFGPPSDKPDTEKVSLTSVPPLGGAWFVALCGMLRSTDLFFRIGALKALSTLTLIAWEHLVNAVLVLPLAWRNRRYYRQVTRTEMLLFLLIGVGASACGILFFTAAFRRLNPALVILLQKLQPLITIGLGIAVLKEQPRRHFWLFAGLAIASSYFVTFSLSNPFQVEWWQLASGAGYAVAAAFFWGGGTAWGKLLLGKYPQSFLLANRFLLGAVFTVMLAMLTGRGLRYDLVVTGTEPLLDDIAYMALIPGLLATAAFYHGLNRLPAAITSILELIFPLSSVIIMWVWFDRPIDGVQIAAAMILFWSMYMVSRDPEMSTSQAVDNSAKRP